MIGWWIMVFGTMLVLGPLSIFLAQEICSWVNDTVTRAVEAAAKASNQTVEEWVRSTLSAAISK
jgi:hypothetical protein